LIWQHIARQEATGEHQIPRLDEFVQLGITRGKLIGCLGREGHLE
jgi:hypothetical protein